MNKKNIQLEQLMPMIKQCLDDGQNVSFMPNGISMLPMLKPGVDKVTLSPITGRLKKYDIPLYQRRNGQYILHRIVKTGIDYACCGDNQYVVEKGLAQDQMIAVVTAFTHKGRVVSVNDRRYKMYCRYWCISRPFRHCLNYLVKKINIK